jgi:hypothetical protein
VPLVLGAPCQLVVLAGREHGRTIPLADASVIQVMLFSTLNGSSARAVMLPSRSGEAKFSFTNVVLYFGMSFWSEDNR